MGKQLQLFPPAESPPSDLEAMPAHVRPFIEAMRRPGLRSARKRDRDYSRTCPNCGAVVS